MHYYLSEVRKKKNSYGKFIEGGFIYDEVDDTKYFVAVIEEREDKVKCIFATKASVEDQNYLMTCNVKNRGILVRAIESKGVHVQGFTMLRYDTRSFARLIVAACLHYYPDTFEELNGKKTISGIDPMRYVEQNGDNPLVKLFRKEFYEKDGIYGKDAIGKKTTEIVMPMDTYTWSGISPEYQELLKVIEKNMDTDNKSLTHDFVFIMKDIDKYRENIVKDFYYKLLSNGFIVSRAPIKVNYVDLFRNKAESDIKLDIDNIFKNNALTVIRMPYEYYRVYEHADEYSKEPTCFKDVDMTLFSNAKYIKTLTEAIVKELKNKQYKSTVLFLCDSEIDYDKNGLFYNELKDCQLKVVNFNEIASDKVEDYFTCRLNMKELDTSLVKYLLNDYISNNDMGLITTNVRVLDSHFDRWYSKLLYKKGEIDEATFKEIMDKNKTGKELLNEMIGEDKVKEKIEKICANFEVQKIREHKGCKKASTNKHMIFKGNPGTGKTEMARILAKMLYEKGIINNDKIVEVGVDEITSQWVGHTEDVCKARIEEAIGGILFIDEAYALMNERVGKNAIDILVKEMENNRERLIVIIAGYKKQMQELLELNAGLKSRIANHVDFDDFTVDELIDIAKKVAKSQDYFINDNGINVLKDICQKEKDKDNFGNGRTVRTLIESAIENQSYRIRPELKKYCNEFNGTQSYNVSMTLLKELDEKDFAYENEEPEKVSIGFRMCN